MVMRLKYSTSKIDDIVLDEKLNGPFILKADVQGAEINVIVEQQKR